MAFLFADGFESFGSAAGSVSGLSSKFVDANGGTHTSDTLVAGRYGGLALRPASNGAGFNSTAHTLVTSLSELIAGFAFRIETAASTGNFVELIEFTSGSGAEVGVAVTPTGALIVYRGTTATVLETTTAGLIDPNKWYYLEFKSLIANSPTGTWTVHLDDVQVADGTGDTLANSASITKIALRGRTTAAGHNFFRAFDDLYILSTSGSPSARLGPRHVYTIFPTAIGDDSEFTPTSGDNYTNVDDNGHDTDTSYVESSVENAQDLYQFGNTSGATDIDAVLVYAIARKTDVTAFDYIAMAKSGGDEATGDPFLIDSTTYGPGVGVFLVDPDTAAAWTESAINAAQFGLKVGY